MTEESWKAHPSTKLDTLIQICQHHLAHDDAIPLMIDSNRADDNALIVTPDYVSDARLEEGLGPDKIVMYTAFPSQNPIVMAVSTVCHEVAKHLLTWLNRLWNSTA